MNNEIKDGVGNILQPGDLVAYADSFPTRASYLGKISHVTSTGRLALCGTVTECVDNTVPWALRIYRVKLPLGLYDTASIYRHPETVIKYEKINISN